MFATLDLLSPRMGTTNHIPPPFNIYTPKKQAAPTRTCAVQSGANYSGCENLDKSICWTYVCNPWLPESKSGHHKSHTTNLQHLHTQKESSTNMDLCSSEWFQLLFMWKSRQVEMLKRYLQLWTCSVQEWKQQITYNHSSISTHPKSKQHQRGLVQCRVVPITLDVKI